MITLSERLRLIAEMVPMNAGVCDVGTDHGYLPAFLIASRRAKSVIATDIKEKPLENARKNLESFGISEVELRLCDGLSAVRENEADTIIIAGMGGEVISGIIERTPWLKSDKTLILQPMTSSDFLRVYLSENGFNTQKEVTLEENGKLYSVILSRFDGKKREVTPLYRYIGKIEGKTKTDLLYIERQYRRLKKCADDLEGVGGMEEKYREYAEASSYLENFLKTL